MVMEGVEMGWREGEDGRRKKRKGTQKKGLLIFAHTHTSHPRNTHTLNQTHRFTSTSAFEDNSPRRRA